MTRPNADYDERRAAFGFIRSIYGRWVAPLDHPTTLAPWEIVALWLCRILLAGVIIYQLYQATISNEDCCAEAEAGAAVQSLSNKR
jgi:hypothetical protein